jgi:hypothetical protein
VLRHNLSQRVALGWRQVGEIGERDRWHVVPLPGV